MQSKIGHGCLASLDPLAYKVPSGHRRLFPLITSVVSAVLQAYTAIPHQLSTLIASPSRPLHPLCTPSRPLHPHPRLATLLQVTRNMPSQKSDSSASSTRSIPPEQLIALPSLACSLSSLPQAKSIDGLSLHPSMLAQRNAESQAKVTRISLFCCLSVLNTFFCTVAKGSVEIGHQHQPLTTIRCPCCAYTSTTLTCAGESDAWLRALAARAVPCRQQLSTADDAQTRESLKTVFIGTSLIILFSGKVKNASLKRYLPHRLVFFSSLFRDFAVPTTTLALSPPRPKSYPYALDLALHH